FFTAPPPTLTSSLPLHDALPILRSTVQALLQPIQRAHRGHHLGDARVRLALFPDRGDELAILQLDAVHRHGNARQIDLLIVAVRSEEHTSELQSRENLVCRLLLE